MTTPCTPRVAALTCGFLALSLWLPAEIDRTKKQEAKAQPELERGPRKGESHKDYHERVITEGEDNLKEIQKLLEEIQDDLAKQKTGAATQTRQRNVVKEIDKLLEKLGKG